MLETTSSSSGLLPSVALTPLTVTAPALCAVGYARQVSSSTQAALPPQGVLQNGTRGVVSVQSPSDWGFSQIVVTGVGPS